jgi:hypothetical protein
MTNPIQLVVDQPYTTCSCCYYFIMWIKLIYIYIYICTQSLLKSLDNKATHIVPLRVCWMYYYLGECGQPCTPWLSWVVLKLIKSNGHLSLALAFLRVEVPEGSYTLVPVDGNEGAGGDVHYVTVEQDLGQSPEDCLTTCAKEGKPRFYH